MNKKPDSKKPVFTRLSGIDQVLLITIGIGIIIISTIGVKGRSAITGLGHEFVMIFEQ